MSVLILVVYLIIVLPAMALITANPKRLLLMVLAYLPLVLLDTPPLATIAVAWMPVAMLNASVQYGRITVKHYTEQRTLALTYVLFGAAASILLIAGEGGLASLLAGFVAAFPPLLLTRSLPTSLPGIGLNQIRPLLHLGIAPAL